MRFLLSITLTISLTQATEPKFKPETIDPTIEIGYGLAIGDVDGDTRPDILLADKKDIVWYQNPTWQKHTIARNLTLRDNVCIAARDLDGDGKVEIAVGAQWNPGETTDPKKSGAIFYLAPPESGDRTQPWTPITLPHDPTTHRMHWAFLKPGRPSLVVIPLHGIGNKKGTGENKVKITAYAYPKNDPTRPSAWKSTILDESLHITHNADITTGPRGGNEHLLIAGRQGIRATIPANDQPSSWAINGTHFPDHQGMGEVRAGPHYTDRGKALKHITTIEPLHGNELVLYTQTGAQPDNEPLWSRTVLDDSLNQGHALACGDLLKNGRQQIIAGWRKPNTDGKTGIRLYNHNPQTNSWDTHTIDDGSMACEDLKLADLNADGKLDIIASGRDSKNVIIYWNQTALPARQKPTTDDRWIKHTLWQSETDSTPTAVAGDYNNDGLNDVIFSASKAEILLLAPDWKPIEISNPDTRKGRSIHSETMDVDGDGDLDFVGAGGSAHWLENPGGTKSTTQKWTRHEADPDLQGIHCLLACDVNKDGKQDLLVNQFAPNKPVPNSITWLEIPDKPKRVTHWTRNVFANEDAPGGNHYMGIGDLNGDGHLDITCGAKGAPFENGNWFAWWKNPGPGNMRKPWTRHTIETQQLGATNILPADLDGDGDTDLMASRGHGAGILWYENTKGNATEWKRHDIDPRLSGPHCLTIGDFDGDGDTDAATTALIDKKTVWYENNGKGVFQTRDIDHDQSSYDIRAIDIDKDGDLDLLVAGQSSKNVVYYENRLRNQ